MNFRKKLALVGLVAMAGLAPLQSKANETNRTEKTSVRQEQLQAVVRTAMNANIGPAILNIKREAAKYMDFPSFIPVTKDGQFNESKCQQLIKDFDLKKNFPHVKKYVESLESGVSPEKAYKRLAHEVANGDKEKEAQLAEMADSLAKVAKAKSRTTPAGLYAFAGLLLYMGLCFTKGDSVGCYGEDTASCGYVSIIAGAAIIAGGLCFSKMADAECLESMEKALPEAYQASYNAYVERTITQEKATILKMDEKQAAEMVKFSQEQAQTNLYPKASGRDGK